MGGQKVSLVFAAWKRNAQRFSMAARRLSRVCRFPAHGFLTRNHIRKDPIFRHRNFSSTTPRLRDPSVVKQ